MKKLIFFNLRKEICKKIFSKLINENWKNKFGGGWWLNSGYMYCIPQSIKRPRKLLVNYSKLMDCTDTPRFSSKIRVGRGSDVTRTLTHCIQQKFDFKNVLFLNANAAKNVENSANFFFFLQKTHF
jgi:hypothetical protein